MPFELQSKQITVCGETLTVYQASNLMETKRSLMVTQADEKWKGQAVEGMEEQATRYLETLLYPSLVVCTTGNLPTLEQFLNMPAEDTAVWEAAAKELNPRWFPNLAERTPEEQSAETEKNE